jgi:hypothetical protein
MTRLSVREEVNDRWKRFCQRLSNRQISRRNVPRLLAALPRSHCGWETSFLFQLLCLRAPSLLLFPAGLLPGCKLYSRLTILISNSAGPGYLNRLGNDPLGYIFGRGRIGCRAVHTIPEMIDSFTAYVWNSSIDKSLSRTLDS